MRAAVYHGRGDVRIEEVADARWPGPGEVRLRVLAASVCGTDVAEYDRGPHLIPIVRRHLGSGHLGPVILGHEMVGVVEQAGPGVELKPGQRVVPGCGAWCGDCGWCRTGRPNLCARYYTFGLQADGGLAEMVTVPAYMCRPVPQRLRDEHAPLAQPMSIALHAVRRAGGQPGEPVLLIGAGGIGAFILAALQARGLGPLLVADISVERLRRAGRIAPAQHLDASGMGAADAVLEATAGEGAALVVEASGSPAGLRLALGSVRRGGRVALVGLQTESPALDLHDLVIREVDLVTSNAHICEQDLPEALDVLAASGLGDVVMDRMIRLDRLVPDGLQAMAEGRVNGKVVVRLTQ
ncbi:MAG TPA: alcohol dehydrogenase catalytic domain-containing protein [Candidatus Acidoferrales bacterium]|nr:alcohol dehydrogenase catalytic domain-containing protein [Candidatus Acidoferrales bacterium]